jgi:hypothetical protein
MKRYNAINAMLLNDFLKEHHKMRNRKRPSRGSRSKLTHLLRAYRTCRQHRSVRVLVVIPSLTTPQKVNRPSLRLFWLPFLLGLRDPGPSLSSSDRLELLIYRLRLRGRHGGLVITNRSGVLFLGIGYGRIYRLLSSKLRPARINFPKHAVLPPPSFKRQVEAFARFGNFREESRLGLE